MADEGLKARLAEQAAILRDMFETLAQAEEAFEEQRPFEDIEACCSVPGEAEIEDELLYRLRRKIRADLARASRAV